MLLPSQDLSAITIEAEPVPHAPSNAPLGPSFELIEETTWEALARSGRQLPFSRPVLVKGGVQHWPAWKKWSFEFLAGVCEGQGSEAPVKFTDGLVEQGVTKGRPFCR
ncbi:cupin-like domain-containing protein [Polaromonas sp. P2-4]|nr:cupin-like domain-containing protein [Polaromonas sp. P2-4]